MGRGIDLDTQLVDFYDGILLGKRARRGKSSAGGSLGGGASSMSTQEKAQETRATLGAIAKGVPEVMVKVTGGGQGMRQVRNHLDYVSRNGELALEDQNGDLIAGKQEVQGLGSEWQRAGSFVAEESTRKEAFNIVLSMPPGVDRLAVERAGRDFAANQFNENFQYVFVRHDDEDHPHIHVVVKARGYNGKRLNPRKSDLHQWREDFARSLRAHGVEATATKRQQRLRQSKGVGQAITHMTARGETPTTQGRASSPERVAKAKAAEVVITAGYKELIAALKTSSRADQSLGAALEQRLFNRSARAIDANRVDRGFIGRD